MNPYREAPLVVRAGDPPGPRWVIHSHYEHILTHQGTNYRCCRWCNSVTPNRKNRCRGRRRFIWFGTWLCPARAHHHVNCRYCGRDWLEATCDEATSDESAKPLHTR